MSQEQILQILKGVGALVEKSHIVLTSDRHSDKYVDKNRVNIRPSVISALAREIAEHFSNEDMWGIDVVAAPAIGAIALSQWVGHWLETITGRTIFVVHAAREEGTKKGFIFKRGHDILLPKKGVLVVEDVITTGGSVKAVVKAVRANQGKVLGVGAIWNRGNISPKDIGDVPELFALVNRQLESWPKQECPLCRKGEPINLKIGRGKDFIYHCNEFLICNNPNCEDRKIRAFFTDRRKDYYKDDTLPVGACPTCGNKMISPAQLSAE